MKGIEIRDFCGDYALDIPMGEGCVHTIYFNSYRNAKTVKRIMEVDDSDPNAATVCDMVEVVRCKDCKHWGGVTFGYICREWSGMTIKHYTKPTEFCCRGEKKEQNGV